MGSGICSCLLSLGEGTVEHYIQKNFSGHICAAYGCPLGGPFAGLWVQQRNVHIGHAILGSSDLAAPIENNISVPVTAFQCFCAAKMGGEYLRRYRQHFKAPDIRRHDMQHEELLICRPERWVEEIKSCCGLEREEGD